MTLRLTSTSLSTGRSGQAPQKTITRKQLVALTGLSLTKINNVSHSKTLRFPYSIGKIGREHVWDRAQILDWMHNNNIHADLPGISLNDNPCKSTLDNQLAVAFLTARKIGS